MNNKKETIQKIKAINFHELTWKQIMELDREKTIFYLPIAPMEEHGPHLPVGTDLMITKDTVNEAIRILINKKPELSYVVLPYVPLGYCKFNLDFPGSISNSGKTIKETVYDICSSLAVHGFVYIIICTFHMSIIHLKAIYTAMKKLKSKYHIRICEPWGPFFHSKKIEKNEPKLGFDTSKEIHGGFRETSLMKYQYPYLVDESYINLQSIYRDINSFKNINKTFKQLGFKDGYIGSPSKANADYGRWYFSQIVDVYVKATIDLHENRPLADLPNKIKREMKLIFWH
jgi:creatinine amidohydrolase